MFNRLQALPLVLGVFGLIALGSKLYLVGLIFIGAAVALWMLNKTKITGTVVLSTSGGEVKALTSEDTGFIQRIVAALNDAIIHRG